MSKNIPLNGQNVNDTASEKDAMSLLILRQAFIDATEDAFTDEKITDEITDEYIEKKE